ncbi:DUF1365 domain-containing protein [Williamsia deligens]|uniref:DUF1365 domain-containing protein n=1 Tax=Williamsia deligens TaxID=321325 RepID=A0ABW3GB01_9NOCA|nr:DUF1365 domain-containing protein [Williamsia deligens]MCP2196059.1 hypothetical protein [Williamsia deligens]
MVTASTAVTIPDLPAVVIGEVGHARTEPVAHRFRHRAYQWLVDLDAPVEMPRLLRPFARFRAADHLGGRGGGPEAIRADVERFAAAQGVDLPRGSRILMLANARVLGYVFDPLSVFWCLGPDGDVVCLVAEVHNTYGERTAYLLHPDRDGRARTDKTFYVSPFNDVSGSYRMRFGMDRDRVEVTITLERPGQAPFHAVFGGTPRRATPARVLATVLTMPLMPQRARALITVHGVWLWLRRLPIVPRPEHVPTQEVQR